MCILSLGWSWTQGTFYEILSITYLLNYEISVHIECPLEVICDKECSFETIFNPSTHPNIRDRLQLTVKITQRLVFILLYETFKYQSKIFRPEGSEDEVIFLCTEEN